MKTINTDIFAPYHKYPFLEGPTRIQPLTKLNKQLNGVEVYIKRDDIMGMGLAGNKLRKLEYLIGDALQKKAGVIITSGGLQSNHARLTAVAASYAGINYELILTSPVPIDDADYTQNGNILIEHILDAKIHTLPKGADSQVFIDDRLKTIKENGGTPYLIPLGGSSPIGCLGYAACFYEIMEQSNELGFQFNQIVIPNGSGGTHAGLLAGLKSAAAKDIQIKSYTVLASLASAKKTTYEKALAALHLLNPELSLTEEEIDIDPNFLGPGYGIPTPAMVHAVKLLARTEGIFLDPVYSGKAFAGMIADIQAGKYPKGHRILFIHTGGLPGLFAYKSAFDSHS
jgi:L-cysteate sulfo-lyase